MGAFNYQALDERGKKIKGIIEADSDRHARAQLRQRKLKPIKVSSSRGKADAASQKGLFSQLFQPRIKAADLALQTRQMAILLRSGLPLDEVLQAVAKQTGKPRLTSILLQIRGNVTEGYSFAQALGDFPRVYNELYRSMVKAGEHAGFLGEVMERLADYTESRQHTQQELQGAMVYPIILIVIAISVVGGLMTFLVPELVRIFQNTGNELPLLTRAVIAISDVLSAHGLNLLLGLCGLFIGGRLLLRNEQRRFTFHGLLLRMPLIGTLVRNVDTARFASTLSILISSGVPLLEGLRIAGEVLSNLVLRAAAASIAEQVREGGALHRAMAQTERFPPMMVHMVASGEASGKLETMLERAATNQERELQVNLKSMMNLLEPLMVLTMGGIVLLIVLAVLLPVFNLNDLVK